MPENINIGEMSRLAKEVYYDDYFDGRKRKYIYI